MINRTKLLADLKLQVRDLEGDLRERFGSILEYKQRLTAEWQAARDAGRTAEALESWVEAQFTQSAVAWVLACVFVRFCEDNDLLEAPLIAGTDSHGRSAVARQEAFYLQHPTASDNDYLRDVFAVASRLPGLSDVLKVQQNLLSAPVSADMGKQLVRFFRATDADSGGLVHDFADPDWNTRFLGDLYQDLSEAARERYALLQTPEFVESFILDRTLTPALDIYTLEEVDLIDPTCGSGHFLLGAFERLAPRWLRKLPGNVNVALQEVLNRIAGIDLNPYAVVIARFRLLIAALKMAQVHKLRLAPDFHLHIETGDSLLHGFDQRDYTRAQATLGLNNPQENLGDGADHRYRHAFAAEDLEATNAILSRKYAVVVGNPPYIAVKDRAVSALYRERFSSCHGKYQLVAPFCERFWALAKSSDATARSGYIGLIVGNGFMKREFGKKLVEDFFPTIDLTHVIDTSVAHIPGHGTPTVILFGRMREPRNSVVRAVMGIKGELSTPADPAQAVVWNAIVRQIDQTGSISEWVSTSDVDRSVFSAHPWSIGGGGATELKEKIEEDRPKLEELAGEIGIFGMTNADEVMLAPRSAFYRSGVEAEVVRELIVGDAIRDWSHSEGQFCVFPYIDGTLCHPISKPGLFRWLWPYKTTLGNRATFSKNTYFTEGRPWWEWHQIGLRRLATPLTITFSFVATHNHFILDRGGSIFNRSAPIIKLKADAKESEHHALLGLLNSSLACFWMQQICHNKGGPGGGSSKDEKWHDFFEHDGSKLKKFPVAKFPDQIVTKLASEIDSVTQEIQKNLPGRLFESGVPTAAVLLSARSRIKELRSKLMALQEELDWRIYNLYELTTPDLCWEQESPELSLGQRAFEIVLARDVQSGKQQTRWFEWLNCEPCLQPSDSWPVAYRAYDSTQLI